MVMCLLAYEICFAEMRSMRYDIYDTPELERPTFDVSFALQC